MSYKHNLVTVLLFGLLVFLPTISFVVMLAISIVQIVMAHNYLWVGVIVGFIFYLPLIPRMIDESDRLCDRVK